MQIKNKYLESGVMFLKRFVPSAIAALLVGINGNLFKLSSSIHWAQAIEVGVLSGILILIYLLAFKQTESASNIKRSIFAGAIGALAFYMVHESGFIEPVISGLLTGGITFSISYLKQRYFWW